MAPRISKEVMNGYREQFKVFDINGDGLITRMELRRIMGALGHPIKDRDVAVIWKEVDKNADGVIDFNEFVEFMERARPKLNGHNQMRDLFKMFDKKGTGLVSIKELELAMTSLGEDVTTKEVRDMLQEADRDGDGKVNFREFEQLFKDSLQTL